METALFIPGDVQLLPVCSPLGHFSLIAWKQAKYENMQQTPPPKKNIKRAANECNASLPTLSAAVEGTHVNLDQL